MNLEHHSRFHNQIRLASRSSKEDYLPAKDYEVQIRSIMSPLAAQGPSERAFVCVDLISAPVKSFGQRASVENPLCGDKRRRIQQALNCEICLWIPTAIIWVDLSVDYFQGEVAASPDFTPSFSSFVFAWKGWFGYQSGALDCEVLWLAWLYIYAANNFPCCTQLRT
jgi:hypothetical protein